MSSLIPATCPTPATRTDSPLISSFSPMRCSAESSSGRRAERRPQQARQAPNAGLRSSTGDVASGKAAAGPAVGDRRFTGRSPLGAEGLGLLVALPLVAGPILFIASAEHGVRFGAHAASASLLGLAALAAFVVVVVKTSHSNAWLRVLAAGWVVYLTVALAFSAVTPAPAIGLTIASGAFLLAGLSTRHSSGPDAHTRPSAVLPKWDIPARRPQPPSWALAVTGLSRARLSVTGVLAPFPVSTSVLAGFVRS